MIDIMDYLKAGYPVIWMQEKDEEYAITQLKEIAQNGKTNASGPLHLNVWSCTDGMKEYDFQTKSFKKGKDALKDPIQAMESIKTGGKNESINVFLNLHPYMEQSQVQQLIKDLLPYGKHEERHIVIVSPEVKIPSTLEKDIALISYELPKKDALRAVLQNLLEANNFSPIEEESRILDAATGLTLAEAENAFSLALVKHKGFPPEAIQTVQELKTQYIGKDGMLTYIQPKITMDDIAGLDELKKWLTSRAKAMTVEAREYGLPLPKGMLLAGVPGSGKSYTAKAVSAAWKLPLLQFDLSQVFGSLVGESEQKMRAALQTAEAISPCILWIDEIEKALAGVGGNNDSGVTSRVFGQFLTWMQEKSSMVFVIATANNVNALPPEFLRKGRFDEFFWVDLPNETERKAIFNLHIQKVNRVPSNYPTEQLATHTTGFSGAEIEEVVKSALFKSFEENRELETKDLLKSIKDITPLSVTMKEQIEGIRAWAKDRARNASWDDESKKVDLTKIQTRSERTIHM
ncbi:AAA family ATPase [Sporosarcina sp. FSL K6-1508]|uniref:AAA family ATPase n=1 Tax=Sporosarcina sp. FSL K6-1508 TaxID=2921553 RepID=UPI0030F9C7FA